MATRKTLAALAVPLGLLAACGGSEPDPVAAPATADRYDQYVTAATESGLRPMTKRHEADKIAATVCDHSEEIFAMYVRTMSSLSDPANGVADRAVFIDVYCPAATSTRYAAAAEAEASGTP
jgi:hypothetical protein